jgi:Domain of unknown function (DUF4190)/zinc-ribbon domain
MAATETDVTRIGAAAHERAQARTWVLVGLGLSIAGGGLVLIATFLKWYSVDLGRFGSVSVNGWNGARSSYSGIAGSVGAAAAIVAVVFLVLLLAGVARLPLAPIGWVLAGLGAACGLFVLVRYVQHTPSQVDKREGFYVAWFGSGLLVAGGIVSALNAFWMGSGTGDAALLSTGEVVAMERPAFCGNCGTAVPDSAHFCGACGAPMEQAAAPIGTTPPGVQYAAQPPPAYYAPPVAQARNNGLAIASMVLGIVWVYWIGSILAVIFGHVSLSQINKSRGTQQGRGMAIAGLVLGYVGLGVLVIVIIAAIADNS